MSTVAFDADDTLWHNENLFDEAHQQLTAVLAPYHDADWILERLYATEMRNLNHFGYGVKGFTLSMIETAIELTEGRISGAEINRLIDIGKTMLKAPVEVLPHVTETIEAVAETYPIMLITKGDLFDQESKLARSGLGDWFDYVEIVSEKSAQTYHSVLRRHAITPASFVMVGNSLRSDILPVVEIGGAALHIPYHITWTHERVEATPATHGYVALESIRDVPAWLATHFE